MERDTRRDRSQWRGCHKFNNIVCDGDQVGNQKRSGGLRMGHTYYYYYELDGSTETYDPTKPTTNTCPYLPGQTVNTVEVPLEHSLSRIRSASMNSLRTADFKTMEPSDRFMAPRPAPPVPSLPDLRIGSSPVPAMSLVHKRSARSLSPAPSWKGAARRFFARKKTNYLDSDAGSETEVESYCAGEVKRFDEPRSITPLGGARSRDLSPECLRRFLSDDRPHTPEPAPKLFIPDEIVEENDDDDNFATSAVSDTAPYTMLSPPPFQRSFSSSSSRDNINGSATTIVPVNTRPENSIAANPVQFPSAVANVGYENIPRSHFSFSTIASSTISPTSPQSAESRDPHQFSFFDESDDEDEAEDVFPNDDGSFAVQPPRRGSRGGRSHSPITGYSLPQPTTSNEKRLDVSRISTTALGSPGLVARLDSGVALGNADLLGRPDMDAGLGDLVSDMGWMADVIQPKFI